MRTTVLFFSLLLILTFAGCDYVKSPVQNGNTGGPPVQTLMRKILVEDYTGHRCGTCPPAAIAAEQLISDYGDQVVILGIHAGFLATPLNPNYTNDFQTAVATSWFNGFGFIATPTGMINRMGYPTSQHPIAWGTWSTVVDTMVTQNPEAYISIAHSYNTSTRTITGTVKTKFYRNFSGLYKLVIVLQQDSIIGPQLDNSQNPPDITNYVHRHVLRDNISSQWGDTLLSTAVLPGDSIMKNFNYTIATTYGNIPCDDNKCHIVAFFYDDNTASPTYRQVIQAEEVKVR